MGRSQLAPRLVAAAVAMLVACGQFSAVLPETLTTPESTSTADGLPGQIAFLDAIGNVGIIRPDGSQVDAITDDAGPQDASSAIRRYDGIAWSQVSGHLAFTERVDGPRGELQERVLVVEAGSGETQSAFERAGSSPFYLYWAPHDQSLTFLASRIGQTDLELWLWRVGELQRLDQGQPYYWAWSPLGDSIVTHVGGAGQSGRIGRLLGPGEASAALQETPAVFQAPAFSPDGSRVIVASGTGSARLLTVLNADGSRIQELVRVSRAVAFDWSPTGETLAFVEQQSADIDGFGELMLLDMTDPEDSQPYATGIEQVAAFFWSPNGDRIAALTPVLEQRGRDEQIRREIQAGELRLRLVVLDVASGEVHSVTEFVPTAAFLGIVPFYDQYQRSSTIWSPDGEGLVFTGRRPDGFGGLFVVDLRGDDLVPRLVARAELAFWSFVE